MLTVPAIEERSEASFKPSTNCAKRTIHCFETREFLLISHIFKRHLSLTTHSHLCPTQVGSYEFGMRLEWECLTRSLKPEGPGFDSWFDYRFRPISGNGSHFFNHFLPKKNYSGIILRASDPATLVFIFRIMRISFSVQRCLGK